MFVRLDVLRCFWFTCSFVISTCCASEVLHSQQDRRICLYTLFADAMFLLHNTFTNTFRVLKKHLPVVFPWITFLKFSLGGTITIGLSGVPLFRMTCNNMAHLAESGRLHALLMGLEHRYYGGKAFDGVMNFSVENLKFLSSHSLCYSCWVAYPTWLFLDMTLSEILKITMLMANLQTSED